MTGFVWYRFVEFYLKRPPPKSQYLVAESMCLASPANPGHKTRGIPKYMPSVRQQNGGLAIPESPHHYCLAGHRFREKLTMRDLLLAWIVKVVALPVAPHLGLNSAAW